jgi:hypothetical protein
MTGQKTRHRSPPLESRIFAAFEQAIAEGRLDVAEHLLRALEVLATARTPEALLDRAYLRIARPEDS